MSGKKDKLRTDCALALAHDRDRLENGAKNDEALAGKWLLQRIPAEDGSFPAELEPWRAKAFRLQCLTGHFSCPAGLYLCGMPSDSGLFHKDNKAAGSHAKELKLKRNAASTYCFVQALRSLSPAASSFWTIEPADGQVCESLGGFPADTLLQPARIARYSLRPYTPQQTTPLFNKLLL